MKTTAFKVFASCVAVVCLASSSVSRAVPVQQLDSGTSENPIIEKQGFKQLNNFLKQNFKPHDSKLITNEVVQEPSMAVHDPMVSQRLYRQRSSYDPEVENRLQKEIEGDDSMVSVDSKEAVPILPDPSNEVQDSQQSNEVQDSQQSNEVQDSQQSNEVQDSQQSNEVQDSQQSNEVQDSQQSNEDQDSQQSEALQDSQKFNEEGVSKAESFELNESDDIYESEEKSDHSASSNDSSEESDNSTPPEFLRTTF